MKAWLNLRHAVPERRRAFYRGLERLGYAVIDGLTSRPGPRDILVTWNRIREGHAAANAFEARGLPVLVAENGYLGTELAGDRWYALSRNHHNGAGSWPVGEDARWDSLGVELRDFRTGDGETVVLPQRGIGPPGVAMPPDFGKRLLEQLGPGARIRPHPGTGPAKPLEDDLRQAVRVVTWGSGAALKALTWGIAVQSHLPGWIGEQDNTDAGRLAMFRRLAWAQWRLAEIASGEALARLLR